MGMAGQRVVGDGVGTFEMSVLNLGPGEQRGQGEPTAKESGQAYQTAAQTAGGSSSSYSLTGYRLNSATPVQLYLNPANAPSGMTDASTRDAIAAGANTWDDNVAANIFADGIAVIVDSSKVVDNPLSSTPKRDGYNVNAWWGLGNNYLGLCRWWTNGAVADGYYSIIEADVWYSRDKSWTTDWNTAVSTGQDRPAERCRTRAGPRHRHGGYLLLDLRRDAGSQRPANQGLQPGDESLQRAAEAPGKRGFDWSANAVWPAGRGPVVLHVGTVYDDIMLLAIHLPVVGSPSLCGSFMRSVTLWFYSVIARI